MRREWAALIFAMTFPGVMAYVYFVALAEPGAAAGNSAVQITYAITKVLQFSYPVVYLIFVARRELKPGPFRPDGLLYGIVFGLVVGASIVVLAEVLSDSTLAATPEQVRKKVAEFGVATPLRFAALATFLSVVHSLLEEYYWRWFVFGRLRRLTGFFLAAVLSSLAFTAHHVFVLNEYLPGRFWSAVMPFSLGIAAGGFVWCWLYQRTGSLLGPWISHFLVDAGIMIAGYRMIFPANAA